MFPLWFALLGGSFVFLDVGHTILFFVFPLFWVLWCILCIPTFFRAMVHLLLAGFHIIEQHKRQKKQNAQSTQEPHTPTKVFDYCTCDENFQN
jgi:hypothetical protein